MNLRPRYASFELLLYNKLLDKPSQFVVEFGMKVAVAAYPRPTLPPSLRNLSGLCVSALSSSTSRAVSRELPNRDNRKSFISNVYRKLGVGTSPPTQLPPNPQAATTPARQFLFFLSTLNCRSKVPIRSGLSTSLPELLLAQAMSGVSPLSATLTKNSGVVGSTPPQPAPNGQPATELHLAEAMSGVSPLSAMLTKKPGVGCYAQPEAAAEPYCASRFTIDTRNCGLAFSAGSISYVCAVFVGS